MITFIPKKVAEVTLGYKGNSRELETNKIKAIVGAGISEVVYVKIYSEPDSLTKELFSEAGVKLRQLKLNIKEQCNRIIDIINQ